MFRRATLSYPCVLLRQHSTTTHRTMSTQAIAATHFELPGQTDRYQGKVRDVYTVGDRLVMVASDRISAFDHILPRAIPYKGQVLNSVAAHFLESTRHIAPNWLESVPDPNVSIGKACKPYPVEMVIRGYLTGHAWRVYRDGGRELCGVPLPDGLREHDRLPAPIITPATKAEEGHDEDISREEILRLGIVPEAVYIRMEQYTRALFEHGTAEAARQGLILVDTKYEFGDYNGELTLIDEIHTPDSSRYFYAEGYEARQAAGEAQRQLSKEFVREWLIANGFQGLEGQTMPDMPDDFVEQITQRYIELYEQLTGRTFEREATDDVMGRMEANIVEQLATSY